MAHIAIIEDSQDIASLTHTILEKHGHTTEHFLNGSHAIEALKIKSFDLIICDLIMPEQDGFDVIDHVKKHDIKTPILVISGGGITAESFDALQSVKGLVNDTLRKPIDEQKLIESVNGLL